MKTKDIVANAADVPTLSTFTRALQAADLVGTYRGMGPFTFFAPTDEAFSKLPEGKLEALMKDKPKIAALLNSHAINGAVLAKDLRSRGTRNRQGLTLTFTDTADGVKVNGAPLAKQQAIESSNGVLHALDHVMTA